jgi:glycosyltransferase involved in cell wall biosynthesis
MRSNLPKVSVIIPVYNGSDFLSDSIESVLAQDYPNIEIIVINDGSSDSGASEAIALSYGSRISYFSKTNGGVSSALNLGIEKMTGDYFAWLSHDDMFYPHRISRMLTFASGANEDLVLSHNWELVDENCNHIRFVKNFDSFAQALPYAFLLGCLTNGCSLLIPRRLFDLVGLFNENLRCVQDLEMFMRLSKVARFKHVPEVLTRIRIHKNQVTILRSARLLNEEEKVQTEFFRDLMLSNQLAAAKAALRLQSEFGFLLWLHSYYREVRYLPNTSMHILNSALQQTTQRSQPFRMMNRWKIGLVKQSKTIRHLILWRFYFQKLAKAQRDRDLLNTVRLYFQVRKRMQSIS